MGNKHLAILGGGNMGRALIGGMLRRGTRPEHITVGESSPAAREALSAEFGVQSTADNAAAVEPAASGGAPGAPNWTPNSEITPSMSTSRSGLEPSLPARVIAKPLQTTPYGCGRSSLAYAQVKLGKVPATVDPPRSLPRSKATGGPNRWISPSAPSKL